MQKDPELTKAALAHIITGFVMFLGMGLLGLAMRLDQAGFWSIDPVAFYAIMTLHGIGMIAAALTAALGGLIEVLNGEAPLSERAIWTAYVINFISFGFLLFATVAGGVGAGWTLLYPLPFHPVGEWTLTAVLAIYFGSFLLAVAYLIYCISFLTGTVRAAGGIANALALRYLFSGGRRSAGNLPTPHQLAATVVSIDGILTVFIGLAWLASQFLQGAGVIKSMDALLVKNVIMLFGHMITNLSIYTALGVLLALLPMLTGREIRTSWPIVFAFDFVLIVLFIPFGHHLYQDFAEPKTLLVVGQFASLASTVPVLLVAILGGMAQFYRSGITWSVPAIFVALGLWGWTFGGIAGFMDAVIPINQVTHNTLWVPGHFHSYYLLGVLAFTWAFMYRLILDRSGGRETLVSKAAAWSYGVGAAGMVLMFLLSGALSVPRRFAKHLPEWQLPDRISVGFVILLAVALLWLTGEMMFWLGRAWRGQEKGKQA